MTELTPTAHRSKQAPSGALIVAFSILGIHDNPVEAQEFEGGSKDSPPAAQVDSWITVEADGKVTAYSGKAEIGQGMSIAQTQLIAEELSVPLDRVTLIYCDTALTPDQGVTSGGQRSRKDESASRTSAVLDYPSPLEALPQISAQC